ncbi:MAG: DUF493 domain-containing protein [Planctomycetaceae bacterium]|nr:DUF493 domain-containing protein [Planctomycetaceae bacterium]
MTSDESLELLESVHNFPCEFTIKVIGRAENDFVGRVLTSVRETLGIVNDPPHTQRETAGGRHVALTLEPWIQSAQQVLDVYRELRSTDGVVVMM